MHTRHLESETSECKENDETWMGWAERTVGEVTIWFFPLLCKRRRDDRHNLEHHPNQQPRQTSTRRPRAAHQPPAAHPPPSNLTDDAWYQTGAMTQPSSSAATLPPNANVVPDEIWIKSFSYLNPRDLLHSVGKVSQTFLRLSSSDSIWGEHCANRWRGKLNVGRFFRHHDEDTTNNPSTEENKHIINNNNNGNNNNKTIKVTITIAIRIGITIKILIPTWITITISIYITVPETIIIIIITTTQ